MSVCQNPACNKEYDSTDKNSDFLCCSFECWEAVNCHEPAVEIFETIHMPSIAMENA